MDNKNSTLDYLKTLTPEQKSLLFEKLLHEEIQLNNAQVTIPRLNRDSNLFPLSFAQRRLWFLDNYEPGSPLYNIPCGFKIEGYLEPGILEQALKVVIERHEILRTSFKAHEEEAVQVIHPSMPVAIQIEDLTLTEDLKPEEKAVKLATEDAQQPFDIYQGPLFRMKLFKIKDDEHVFYINFHHIIADGWSVNIFIQDLAAVYDALLMNKPVSLKDMPIQYVDFAAWQRSFFNGEQMQKQLSYWKNQLAGVPFLDLPTDRSRPSIHTPHGTILSSSFDQQLTGEIKNFCKEQKSTLFMTLLAVFAILLYKYSRQKDMAIGTMIANRQYEELEPIIGFFSNTIAVRLDLSENPPFIDFLESVRHVTMEAYDNQDIPFEKLVEELNPPRDLSRTPIFQTMFIMQPKTEPTVVRQNLKFIQLGFDSRTSKFDLTLYMKEINGCLLADMEYNTDLFDAVTIKRMLNHLKILAKAMISCPAKRIADYTFLSEAERDTMLSDWNATDIEWDDFLPLYRLFEKQVQATPDNTAVSFYDISGVQKTYSYRELNAQANRLAAKLKQWGAGVETHIGVYLDRKAEILIALLGILKNGSTYIPLDPQYPAERINYMLTDSQAAIVITDEDHQTKEFPPTVQVFYLNVAASEFLAADDANPETEIALTNLAYIIYTSGSTGQPKGVQIPHRALVNFLKAMQKQFQLGVSDTLLSVTTFCFDIAGLELYLPILTGAKVVIVSQDIAADGLRLHEALINTKTTMMQATPATWHLLINSGWQGNNALTILCGGEALAAELASELVFRAKSVWNMYGPTETTIWSTMTEVKAGKITIGTPIANTQVYILDEQLQPVAAGIPGEILIGGLGVARGYLNRLELTAAKFIPDMFRRKDGGFLYKTGDLARFLPNGQIECLGRIDFQVKVRGYRIELGEIEAAVAKHPKVLQNITIVDQNQACNKRLVSYIITNNGETIPIKELRDFLKNILPNYMIPEFFVFLDAFPLTPNGKMNRQALPEPVYQRDMNNADYLPPRNELEKKLVKIWQDVLGIESISISDNFFEMGGNSLLVMRIITLARNEGMEISPKQLFKNQTIAELSGEVGKTKINAEQGVVSGEVIMTPFQYYFFEVMRPDDIRYYTLAPILEMEESFEPELVIQVLKELFKQHDALRFRLHWQGEERLLYIAEPEDTVPFSIYDLSSLPEEEPAAQEDKLFNALMLKLDLRNGSHLLTALINYGAADKNRIMMVGHYLPLDMQSWMILLEDFARAYEQLKRGDVIRLGAKTTSVKLWGERLYEHAQSDEIKKELSFWTREPEHEYGLLPVDFPAGENNFGSTVYVGNELSEIETHTIMAIAKHNADFQPNDLLVTALLLILNRHTGKTSWLIDLLAHGREPLFDDLDLSRTIGWFGTIFPVLFELAAANDRLATCISIKKQISAIPNNGLGYNMLKYYCQDQTIVDQLAAKPKPEIYFNYMGPVTPPMSKIKMVNFKGGYFYDIKPKRPHLIQITASVENDGKMHLAWAYSKNVHKEETIKQWAQDYLDELKSLITMCSALKKQK